jgi:hypothetical protein
MSLAFLLEAIRNPIYVIPSVAAAASRALLQPSIASPELAEGEVEESVFALLGTTFQTDSSSRLENT